MPEIMSEFCPEFCPEFMSEFCPEIMPEFCPEVWLHLFKGGVLLHFFKSASKVQ
jgi:hypothetical protein